MQTALDPVRLGRDRARDVDRAVGVEHEQELPFELVDSADELLGVGAHRLGHSLEAPLVHFEHVANLVHEKAHRPFARPDDDVHRELVARSRGQTETRPHLDRGDDLATEVDEAADHRAGERHAGHLLVANDLLDASHVDAEESVGDEEGTELLGLVHWGSHGSVRPRHAG